MKKTVEALWDAWRAGYFGEESIRRFEASNDAEEKDRYIAYVIRHLVDRAESFHDEAMKKYRQKS